MEETRPSGLVEDSLEFLTQSSRDGDEASEQRFEFRVSESRQPGEQVTPRASPKGVRTGNSIHRDNCLYLMCGLDPLRNRRGYGHAGQWLQGKHIGAFRPRPFGLKSSCLLMCSFLQNGPIFVKFPVISLQLCARIRIAYLSPRFAPGPGGVEPCMRISLRFQRQGGAPGAGRASLDSRVRILSGQPEILPISPRIFVFGNCWNSDEISVG